MLRILVLGANGQVGHELLRHLSPLGAIIPCTRNGELPGGCGCVRVDLGIPGSAAAVIEREHPDLIVNAAAYTAVDRAEDEPEVALRINGLALAEIGAAACLVGAGVVHFSTDYVFSGAAKQPYREDDATGPRSAYGESKLAGEQALSASGAEHLILRTAWVYGTRGQNFLRTMLRLGRERNELRVVDDQRGAPTPAFLIAAVTAQILARWWREPPADRAALSGVYHLSSAGETSWCGFARAIFERAIAAGVLPKAPRVRAIASSEFPAKAVRPDYSVLDTTRLCRHHGVHLPDWTWGLDRVVADLAPSG